jgi:hypothetical protein
MRRVAAVLAVAVLSAVSARAAGIHFDPTFTSATLGDLADGLGDVLTFPNLGPAAPTGITGFEVLVAAGGPQVDTHAHWWHAVDGTTVGGVFYGQRVIVRKGLPAHLDVGVQVGQVLGERFWGGEVRWAFLEGGAVSPAAALRVTYSRLTSAPLDLVEVAEGQVLVSKGFLVVTPYAGVGYRRVFARASFGDPVPVAHSADRSGFTGTVGARVTLLPLLHLVGELRQGADRSLYLGVGVGL